MSKSRIVVLCLRADAMGAQPDEERRLFERCTGVAVVVGVG
jgi:hypothetical protein